MNLHRSIQEHIVSLLPKGEAHIEYRMKEHIADVVWLTHKIVFEVQCSEIPLEVALKRCLDYKTLGFSLVWILHTKSFNKTYLTRAERFIRSQTCYYTSLNIFGHGLIFDQFETVIGHKRKKRSLPLPIEVSCPVWKKGKLSFLGDRSFHKTEEKQFDPLPTRKIGDILVSLYDKLLLKCLRSVAN